MLIEIFRWTAEPKRREHNNGQPSVSGKNALMKTHRQVNNLAWRRCFDLTKLSTVTSTFGFYTIRLRIILEKNLWLPSRIFTEELVSAIFLPIFFSSKNECNCENFISSEKKFLEKELRLYEKKFISLANNNYYIHKFSSVGS